MKTSPLLSLHEAAGARLAERPEHTASTTVLTYGDVPAEYAAGRKGALLMDAGDRGLVRVRGGDAASFLHSMLASPVRGIAPESGGPSLLLTPKGKVKVAFQLAVTEDSLLLETPPGGAAALIAALDGYLFSEDVQLEDASEEIAPLEVLGPHAAGLLESAFGMAPPAEMGTHIVQSFSGSEVRVARVAIAGSAGFRLSPPADTATPLWQALTAAGAIPGGLIARDCLRIEAGAALWGLDVGEDSYPQEARWESAMSLEKGCYVGQEVVAKIDTYGGLNKRLTVLRVAHDNPIPAGARLLRTLDGEERDLGLVTSWAYSFELDTGIVLGYVKRRHQAVGTNFQLGGELGEAEIVAFPLRDDALPPTGEFE